LIQCGYYPGDSSRALVINHALDNHNFRIISKLVVVKKGENVFF
jgi:hypothetical protein